MTKGILVVATDPAEPSRDAEFNEWYSNTHGPEVSALPGFTGFTRYRLTEGQQRVPEGTPQYLAVYTLDADDLNETVRGIGTGAREGTVHMSDVLSRNPPPSMIIYELMD